MERHKGKRNVHYIPMTGFHQNGKTCLFQAHKPYGSRGNRLWQSSSNLSTYAYQAKSSLKFSVLIYQKISGTKYVM